jgi:hypothetical protein
VIPGYAAHILGINGGRKHRLIQNMAYLLLENKEERMPQERLSVPSWGTLRKIKEIMRLKYERPAIFMVTESQVTPSGVMVVNYERAGKIGVGRF